MPDGFSPFGLTRGVDTYLLEKMLLFRKMLSLTSCLLHDGFMNCMSYPGVGYLAATRSVNPKGGNRYGYYSWHDMSKGLAQVQTTMMLMHVHRAKPFVTQPASGRVLTVRDQLAPLPTGFL